MEVRSPSVGKVLRITVGAGDRVARGDELLVIESMKVEIPIKASATGIVKEMRVKAGDQVQRNFILAVIEG
jgi:acetyl-CoA carboxylase biotin carboxyl carrier protein